MRWWRTILAWYYRHDFGPEEAERLSKLRLVDRWRQTTKLLYGERTPTPQISLRAMQSSVTLYDVLRKARSMAEALIRCRAIPFESEWLDKLQEELQLIIERLATAPAETIDPSDIEEAAARVEEIATLLWGESQAADLQWHADRPRKWSFDTLKEAEAALDDAKREATRGLEAMKRAATLATSVESGHLKDAALKAVVSEEAKSASTRLKAEAIAREIEQRLQIRRVKQFGDAVREEMQSGNREVEEILSRLSGENKLSKKATEGDPI